VVPGFLVIGNDDPTTVEVEGGLREFREVSCGPLVNTTRAGGDAPDDVPVHWMGGKSGNDRVRLERS